MVNHAGTATRISESINETAVLAAATSRTVHDIGGATNNAAEQMVGIEKAFAEVADHIHLLERTVKMFIWHVSDERLADEASHRSEHRRDGKEGVRTCRDRRCPCHIKQKY